MKILYNFFITLKRYTTSAILNIIGLSLAFAAFIVLMAQFSFEHGYDSYNRNADRTYRLAIVSNTDASNNFSCFSQQLIDKLSGASPHIVTATMYDNLSWNKNQAITITRSNGGRASFQVDFSQVYAPFVTIADITIIEGDKNALEHPWNVIIPESMAKTMFPDESAIGKSFTWEENICSIGAVYKDIPANSVIKNMFYYTRSNDEKFGKNQYNFLFLITIDSPDKADEVLLSLNDSFHDYFKAGGEHLDSHIEMTSLRDLYYTTGVRKDFGDKGNKTRTNIMLAIALLIVIIAVINYINFASSIAPLKIKMLNTQRVMGASLWKIRFSVIIESVMIAIISFLLALLIVGMLASTSFSNMWIADISLKANIPTIAYTALLSLAVGFLAGLYPAFYMTSFEPTVALRGTFAASPRGKVYRSVLIGFQYVISSTLIIASLFIGLQNRFVGKYDLGYNKSQIAIVKISENLCKNQAALSAEMKSNSEIADVAYAMSQMGCRDFYQNWVIELNGETWEFNIMPVSYNFLEVMNIPVQEGRDFRADDENSSDGLLILNRVSPKENGEPVSLNEETGNDKFKVIGFIDNTVHLQTLYVNENPFAFYYRKAYNDGLEYMYIKINEGVDKFLVVDKIKKSINRIEPDYPVQVNFLDAQLNHLYKKDQRIGTLISIVSLLAIVISLIGVFGLVLFETQFRRKEIGIRRVMGASTHEILLMFNRKFVIIALVCFAVAIPLAVYSVKSWLSAFQFRIPLFWWVFAIALCVILFITIITVTVRSRQAANANPVDSIR
jgi:putative ABC transport system permease protein